MTTQISTLSNGLTIVTDRVESLETASLGVWVNVGTRHEPAPLNGVSHFLEHMAFKGTTHRNAREIAETIENVGGHLNAYTSRENTTYLARVLGTDVSLAVDLLSDILQFSTFKEEEFEKERQVVLQEIRDCHDAPDDLLFDLLQEAAFPNQALGRPVLGRSETIKNLSCSSLKHFMSHTYAASQMVLVACGKVDHQELHKVAEEKFCYLPPQSVLSVESAHYQGGVAHIRRPLEQMHMVLGFEGFSLGHKNYYSAALLTTLLGGGMSSRLFQEVREKRALAYSVYGFTSSYIDTGLLGIYLGTSERETRKALEVIGQVLAETTDTLKDHEVCRVKAQLKASLMMALESTTIRCEQLAHQMSIYGRPLSQAEIVDRIEAVTLAEMKETAHVLFTSPPVFTSIGPSSQGFLHEEICSYLNQDVYTNVTKLAS